MYGERESRVVELMFEGLGRNESHKALRGRYKTVALGTLSKYRYDFLSFEEEC